MNNTVAIVVLMVVLLVEIVAFVAVLWYVARVRTEQVRDHVRAEVGGELARAQGELATAMERIRTQDAFIAHINTSVTELGDMRTELEGKLRDEIKGRSAAEGKAERIGGLESDIKTKDARISVLQGEVSTLKLDGSKLQMLLDQERDKVAEKVALLDQAQLKFTEAFKALASDALGSNNSSFLELAKATLERFQEGAKNDLEKRQLAIDELVKPVKVTLQQVDLKIQELEKARVGAYADMTRQVGQLSDETAKLVRALRNPSVRGRWGEMQLRRVVELAGMLNNCDFFEQESVTTEDGRLRPDMIVRLAGGKCIVVDAKVPIDAYFEAIEAIDDAIHGQKMAQHSRQVRKHINDLCERQYWSQFASSPEFVFLFLHGEIFYFAALQHDPELIAYGAEKRVIIATPTTLLALLKTIAFGWQQDAVAKNLQEIADLGKELYRRLATMSNHMIKLGNGLENAVRHYNSAIGSLESNVLTQARRFRDLKSAPEDVEIAALEPIEVSARALTKPELLPGFEEQRALVSESEGDSAP
jgi:DNA recombination protein RmuC